MTVNASRVVEFPFAVPRMLVNNPDLVRVTPISDRSIQLSALRAGVTQLNVWDSDNNVTSLDLIMFFVFWELELLPMYLLMTAFHSAPWLKLIFRR